MVRFKGRFWFLLLIFGLYLSCPGYPAVKSINIKNLPANQDMDRVERDYGDAPLTPGATDCADDDWSNCSGKLNDTAKCNKCVDLEEDCPGCCLEDDPDAGGKKVLCPDKDSSDNPRCKVSPFYETDCDLEDCDGNGEDTDCYDGVNCRIKCSNYSYKSSSKCKGKEGTGGKLKSKCSGEETYGLQRAGCPNKNSDLLAPDNDDCRLEEGTEGLGRKWKCKVTGIIPKFAEKYVNKSLCSPDLSLTFTNKPDSTWGYGDYYAVTEVSPRCPADTCTNTCKSKCEVTVSSPSCCANGNCEAGAGRCRPSSCTPKCPDKVCNYNCVSDTACLTADESTNDCVCVAVGSCTPGSCTPECTSDDGCGEVRKSCEGPKCGSPCSPESDTYYVYVLSDKYKEYIEKCIEQADEYEKCINEFDCCRDGVCPKKTDGKECSPGFEVNCDLDKCEELVCYYSDCKEYIGDEKTESCAQLASDANNCMSEHKGCFQEIDSQEIDPEKKIKYDFVARRGDSLTIIWQIDAKSANDNDAEGINFYTLVKVFELDGDKNPRGDPAHISMMNVKNLDSNFTIYGVTNTGVDSGELKAGKFYRVKLYYFLPNAEFCDKDKKCEDCTAVNEVEVSYISLTLVRARE